jgi:hypothetical protein
MAATFASVWLPQEVSAQYYTRLGPTSLYPRPENYADHRNIPPTMRDAIQHIVNGTRSIDIKPRIMGGEPASEGSFPWMASIELKGANPRDGHFCGGAFVAPEWVMTAAHCVKPDSANKVQVYGGSSTLETGGAVYLVDRVVIHDKYDDSTQDFDVALLHLTTRFDGTTVRLSSPSDPPELAEEGSLAIAIGWGLTAEGDQVSNVLRRVTVQIVAQKTCNGIASYGGAVTDEMVCAGFARGGRDSCQGDSGGPLVAADKVGTFVQIGIVSWGEGCGRPLKFGVYTRVAAIEPWVEQQIGMRRTPVAARQPAPAAVSERAAAVAPIPAAPTPPIATRSALPRVVEANKPENKKIASKEKPSATKPRDDKARALPPPASARSQNDLLPARGFALFGLPPVKKTRSRR